MFKEKEKIFRSIIKEELDEYKTARDRFYSNPIHWSNNKRKMNGMTVLRGKCNKTRLKIFLYIRFHLFSLMRWKNV